VSCCSQNRAEWRNVDLEAVWTSTEKPQEIAYFSTFENIKEKVKPGELNRLAPHDPNDSKYEQLRNDGGPNLKSQDNPSKGQKRKENQAKSIKSLELNTSIDYEAYLTEGEPATLTSLSQAVNKFEVDSCDLTRHHQSSAGVSEGHSKKVVDTCEDSKSPAAFTALLNDLDLESYFDATELIHRKISWVF